MVIVAASRIFVKKEHVLHEPHLACLGSSMETEHLLELIKPISRVFIVDEACSTPPDLGEGGYVHEITFTELGEEGIRTVMARKDSTGKPHIPNAKANDKRTGDIFGTNVKVAGANGKCVVTTNPKLIDL